MTTTFDTSELWVPVRGYEGLYEVSNYGRVRSVSRVIEGRWGPTKRIGCLLTLTTANGRYMKAALCKDGELKQHQVHRLVLLAFIGDPPEGFVCDHIDNDIRNNNLTNLRWLSSIDNLRRRRSMKLTMEAVNTIRSKINTGASVENLVKEHKVSYRHIKDVIENKMWKSNV